MFKKCLTIILTGVLLLSLSLPAFAATNNAQLTDQEQMKSSLKKVIPDAGLIEKVEKIKLTPANRDRLIAITGDKSYVDKLYTKTSSSLFSINYVIYSTYWVEGSDVLSWCKYKQDVIFDDSYSQSRITYVYPESLNITVYDGHYALVTSPQILDYQQVNNNPARSYCKYQLMINNPPSSFTKTLIGNVRDTSSWTEFY
jgi:hypothetical protein